MSVHTHTLTRQHVYYYPITIQKDLAGLTSLLSSTTSVVPKTLIFTKTKNAACKLFCFLSVLLSGCVSMYHASLTGETKSHCQREFMKDGSLVATVAFGMVRV